MLTLRTQTQHTLAQTPNPANHFQLSAQVPGFLRGKLRELRCILRDSRSRCAVFDCGNEVLGMKLQLLKPDFFQLFI
jgi:hypothetical protein